MEIKPKDVYYWQLLQTVNSTHFLWPWEDDQGSSSFPFSQVLFWWLNNACNHCFSIVHVSLWIEEEAKKKKSITTEGNKGLWLPRICVCVSPGRLFATPWTAAHQAPLSMGFSRKGYWSGLLFPSPGDLPNPGIEPGSPKLQADSLLIGLPGKL